MLLEQQLDNIHLGENGIYYTRKRDAISYPEDGNSKCLQIEEDSFWFNHRNRIIVDAVQRYSPGETFFDIGGGNGYVSKALQDAGVETVLIEPGEQGTVNAKRRGVEKVICGTFQAVGFAPESLGAAGFFDVVEHIEDDHRLMADVASYLRPGAKLYLTVPAYQWLWSNEDEDAGHYRRYTVAGIRELCRSHGLMPLFSSYLFTALPPAIFASRTVPSRLGMNKNSAAVTRRKRQHTNAGGVAGSFFQKLLDYEAQTIASGNSLPMGSSCFLIAEKQ